MGGVYHITMLVSGEQEDAIRLLFRDKNWPCWIKVLTDDSVASLIHAGYLDMFPTMGEDYNLDNSTVYTEIKTEVVDVDNNAAENNDNNATSDNDDKNISKDIKPSFTDEDDNTMDYDMAQDKPSTDPDCVKEEASDEDSPPVTRGRKTRGRQTRNSKKSQNQNKSKSKTDSRLKCALCDTYCVNRTILKRHCRRRHKGQWLEFDCKDCAKKFKTKEELWEHRRVANHKPRKVSTSTSKEVHTTEELIALGHLKCEICSNYYPHKRSLRRHMYKVHKDVLPKWSCAVCGEEFDSRDGLWKHKRQSEHKTSLWALGNYQCDSCGKIYNRYDSFREHKLSCKTDSKAEDESKDFPCDICGLVFKSMLRVKSHKRGVHVVAPVVCHVCGAMCKNKRALLVHRRRHDMKNKKFGCDDCGKTFFNNTLLTQHIRTHTKEKPYKCPMCNYRCAIKQNIHKHAMKVHKTTAKAIDLSGDLSKDDESAVNTSGEYTEIGNTALDLSEEAHSTSMQDMSYSEHGAKMFENESKSYESMAKSYENVAKSYEQQVKPYGIDSKSYETETKPYTQDAKPYEQAPLPDIRFTMSELQKYNTGRRDVFGIDKMMDKDERELQALQSLGALSEGVHDLRSPSVRQAEMESRHPIDPNTSNIHHMPATSMSISSKEKYLGVPYGSAYLNELQDLRLPSAIRSTDNASDAGPKNYTMPPNLSNYPGISDMQFSPRGNETNPYKYNWGAPTSK